MSSGVGRQSTVLIVDDCPILGQALANLLSQEPGFLVLGAVQTRDAGLQQILDWKPDLVLCDADLPNRGAFSLAAEGFVAHPRMTFVFLTDRLDDSLVEQMLQVPARGYLSQQEQPQQIIEALRRIMQPEQSADEHRGLSADRNLGNNSIDDNQLYDAIWNRLDTATETEQVLDSETGLMKLTGQSAIWSRRIAITILGLAALQLLCLIAIGSVRVAEGQWTWNWPSLRPLDDRSSDEKRETEIASAEDALQRK